MKWIGAKIKVKSEEADVVAALLLDFGIEGVEIEDAYENKCFIEADPSNWDCVDEDLVAAEKGGALVKFYLPEEKAGLLNEIRGNLSNFGIVEAKTMEDNWSEAWKEHYKPFKVGKKVVIVPVWEDYKPADGEIVFKIDPGHVFGTGQHQSTAMCIELLEKHIIRGNRVLDIGCGSGILGIITYLVADSQVIAVDTDPSAVKVSLENAKLNNIHHPRDYQAFCGNVLDDVNVVSGGFDLVVANIVADVIIPIIPLLKGHWFRRGVFIAGGIIKDRADEVEAALLEAKFEILEKSVRDEWVAFAARGL